MKRFALSLALIALTACQENSTGPVAGMSAALPATFEVQPIVDGDPPPPPLDTGVVAISDAGAGSFNVTYFLNTQDNNGFLTFKGAQPTGTDATKGARVSYHLGVFSGRGTLSYATGQGTVLVDLSSVNQASTFTRCSTGCFTVRFDRATVTSAGISRPLTGVEVRPFVKRGDEEFIIGIAHDEP